MATLSSAWPTLLDVARRLDPDGSIAAVAEILNQYNEILDDIPWVEGNLPTGHKTTYRTSVPTPTFRLLNQGVVTQKSTSGQFTEGLGMLEAYAEIDKSLADLNGNTNQFRLSEDKAFLEGFAQKVGTTLIYGDTSVNPQDFLGLAPRYWTKTTANATSATQVISALGSGSDNTSVWLVNWAPDKTHGIYPKGGKAGLSVTDKGQVTLEDTNGGKYEGYRTHYKWDLGLSIRDYRDVVRICNIDVSDLLTAGDGTDTSTNLLKYMLMAIEQLGSQNGRPVFYMNQTVKSMLMVKLMNKSNTLLSLDDWTGPTGLKRKTLSFMGIPIRRVDKITNAEATIS